MSRRVDGVMNRLQVYHPSQRDDGVDRDICTPELVLRYCDCGEIRPVDKKRGPKTSRDGYAPTKEKIKDDNNNDENNSEALDDVDLNSKAPLRTAWYLMWKKGRPYYGPRIIGSSNI